MLNRLRVTWNGLGGLPGLSTFYLRSAATDVSAVGAFFVAINQYFPGALALDVPSEGDTIDEATGELTGAWSGTGGRSVAGLGGSGAFAAGVGARVVWNTATVVNGRRVRGGTFLVPLLAACYSPSGDLDSTVRANISSAAATLAASDVTVVWHRPHDGGSDGSIADIVTSSVPSRVSTLRSRRY